MACPCGGVPRLVPAWVLLRGSLQGKGCISGWVSVGAQCLLSLGAALAVGQLQSEMGQQACCVLLTQALGCFMCAGVWELCLVLPPGQGLPPARGSPVGEPASVGLAR